MDKVSHRCRTWTRRRWYLFSQSTLSKNVMYLLLLLLLFSFVYSEILLFLFIFYFRQRAMSTLRFFFSSSYFQLIRFCCCMPFLLCASNMRPLYNPESVSIECVYIFSWLVLYYCLILDVNIQHIFWFISEQQRLDHISLFESFKILIKME